jgi:plasmid stability protein
MLALQALATLYVRDVPEKLYKRLQARARRNGRSLNAEVLELIDEAVLRGLTSDEITDRLAELAAEIDLPPDAPRPEDIIRQERDRR